VRATATVLMLLGLTMPTALAAQGIGLAQLQGGAAFTNEALDHDALAGGRAALGFRSGHFVFGPEVGYYGIGAETHLTTLSAFLRYGARTSTGWYGIAGLGYQGPGTSGGGESLFGAGIGAGWSGGPAGHSGPSAEARYLFSLQDIGGPMFAALLLTVGWEFRW
jgi:hypothetical protein